VGAEAAGSLVGAGSSSWRRWVAMGRRRVRGERRGTELQLVIHQGGTQRGGTREHLPRGGRARSQLQARGGRRAHTRADECNLVWCLPPPTVHRVRRPQRARVLLLRNSYKRHILYPGWPHATSRQLRGSQLTRAAHVRKPAGRTLPEHFDDRARMMCGRTDAEFLAHI
jgi:hypothetical protein